MSHRDVRCEPTQARRGQKMDPKTRRLMLSLIRRGGDARWKSFGTFPSRIAMARKLVEKHHSSHFRQFKKSEQLIAAYQTRKHAIPRSGNERNRFDGYQNKGCTARYRCMSQGSHSRDSDSSCCTGPSSPLLTIDRLLGSEMDSVISAFVKAQGKLGKDIW